MKLFFIIFLILKIFIQKKNSNIFSDFSTENYPILDIYEYPEYKFLRNTEKPVVGVVTQPSSWPKAYDPKEFSYIAASYIKYLESSGLRF